MSRRVLLVVPPAALVLMFAPLAIGLAGCASAPAPDTASAELAQADDALAAAPVEGIGRTTPPGVDFPIPAAARSVVIDFSCAGGGEFALELGDVMLLGQAALTGTCDGTSSLAWPVSNDTGPTLSVYVADGVAWTADPTFSTEPFAADAAVTADCAALSPAVSDLSNAETGFAQSAIDSAEWSRRMTIVAGQLAQVAEGSSSPLADPAAALHALVSDPALTPGTFLDVETPPLVDIDRICDVNQTPLVRMGEFGG